MGNLALHSAEEPDNLRAITGTVEVPTKRDNDAALPLGARPIQEREHAARHSTFRYLLFLEPGTRCVVRDYRISLIKIKVSKYVTK